MTALKAEKDMAGKYRIWVTLDDGSSRAYKFHTRPTKAEISTAFYTAYLDNLTRATTPQSTELWEEIDRAVVMVEEIG